MKEYKAVPAPKVIKIQAGTKVDVAMNDFANIINREAQGGWKFRSTEEVTVEEKPGCSSTTADGKPGCLSASNGQPVSYYMLIFERER